MGILTSGLPTAIKIDDIIYDINYDYRNCLQIMEAFEDNTLTEREKSYIMVLKLFYTIPENYAKAVEKSVEFLNCGITRQKDDNGQRLYSFKHDELYIFSGVDRVLNGRLSKGDFVHWWEFVMAFMELPEDCIMSKIIYFRTQYAKGKLTKEEKRIYTENRELFELPEELTHEEVEKRNKFFSQLENNDRLL